MLQPRVGRTPKSSPQVADKEGANHFRSRIPGHTATTTVVALLGLLLLPAQGSTQYTDLGEPTPALRLNDEDLTTVLLVKNENGRSDHVHGRFLSVRPEVGLLTSTARTFIQEGVTTEYATQVLGTTLENGRIYAQLLKKSSRVLYEPSVVTSWVGEGLQTKALLQSHNDLSNADQPDWQDIDDHLLLEKNAFVGNTDIVDLIDLRSPKVYNNTIKSSISLSSSSLSSSSSGSSGSNVAVTLGARRPRPREEDARRIAVRKVLPIGDLPTYTVKNYFAPSGFSWEDGADNGEKTTTGNQRELAQTNSADNGQPRSRKLYYNQLMGSHGRYTSSAEPLPAAAAPAAAAPQSFPSNRVLSTVTYYGFADFTTVVGDSVIVFSPSTQAPNSNIGHVTSIKGEATLGGLVHASVSNVPITVTEDLILPTYVEQTTVLVATAPSSIVADTSTETKTSTAIFAAMDSSEEVDEEEPLEEDFTTPNAMSEYKAVDALQTSEVAPDDSITVATTTTESSAINSQTVLLSRPSDQDILSIYASLASAEAARKSASGATESEYENQSSAAVAEAMTTSSSISDAGATDPIQPEPSGIQTQGGATTIFFEDDPFANFIEPTSTQKSPKEQVTAADTTTATTNTPKIENDRKEFHEITTTMAIVDEDKDKRSTETTAPEATDTTHLAIATTTSEPVDTEAVPDTTTQKVLAKVIVKEIDDDEDADVANCIRTSQVFLTQLPKTVTFYMTYLTPDEGSGGGTVVTSVETNVVPTFEIEQATKHYCIQSTTVVVGEEASARSPDQLEKPYIGGDVVNDERPDAETRPMIVVRQSEKVTVTEATITTTEATTESSGDENAEEDEIDESENEEEDEEEDVDDDDSAEEIDLIYKTLYTTYTYLTTFFHDDTTSISSHKEVVTNVITSTLGPADSDIQATKLSELLKDNEEVSPTTKFMVPIELESILREEEGEAGGSGASSAPTEYLDDSKLTKTYFTTYTYYTTIFADGETEVMSRTEVYTNYVTDSLAPTHTQAITATSDGTTEQQTVDTAVHEEDNAVLEPTVTEIGATDTELSYSTLQRSSDNIPDLQEYSSVTLVTDVRSSSSNGDHQIINNNNNQINIDPFDDQISSESNTDEIIPSATLLLQTSFTTFTYYTTMYSGDITNVVSRLETVTTVVTETLEPTKTINVEEATLPITYFTTFTYWTKLSKDGEITTLSREETVSNVVTPTNVLPTNRIDATTTPPIEGDSHVDEGNNLNSVHYVTESSPEGTMTVTPDLTDAAASTEPTTYYTTYTYYTTSYVNDQTITDSRFETVTNVVTPEPTVAATSSIPADTTSTSSPVSSSSGTSVERVISYDNKRIIDADGVSTLFFTTEVIAATAADSDGVTTEVTSSSSSLYVDESKKSQLSAATGQLTVNAEGVTVRQYKTGLVRLIEGTKIANHTTTLYQSKVIGTIIDNRYAQIIESTSSFLIEKTKSPLEATPVGEISPTATEMIQPILKSTQQPGLGAVPQVQGSIHDEHAEEEHADTNGTGNSQEDGDAEDNGEEGEDNKDRFPLQSKKSTFTPVIRPFASRNRPQFAPKKKIAAPSSATIITRSDFTPTITATPALKSPGGRFSSSRRGGFSSVGGAAITSSSGFGASLSSSRRFSRPSKPSVGPNQPYGGTASFGGPRNRLSSSRSFPSSSRRPGPAIRGSSSLGGGFRSGLSSGYGSNSRLRIKPTSTLGFGQQAATAEASSAEIGGNSSEEDDGFSTQEALIESQEEETENITENSRRNQNPLLRFRRPLPANRPSGFTPSPRQGGNSVISQRRNPLAARAKTTTTTTTTTTTPRPKPRSFQRPAVGGGGFQGRTRPQSNLFPPRGLFQTQQQQANQNLEENEKKNNEEDLNDGAGDDDSEYEEEDDDDEEGEDDGDDDVNRRRRSHNNKAGKLLSNPNNNPLKHLSTVGESKAKSALRPASRVKRDTDALKRSNFRNRFRRLKLSSTTAADERSSGEAAETESTSSPVAAVTRPRTTGRFSARYQGHSLGHHAATTAGPTISTSNHRVPIRPSRPSAGRAQFTLREKDTTTTQKSHVTRPGSSGSFRRPQTAASSRRTSASITTTSNSRRLKNYGSGSGAGSETTSSRSSGTGRGRSSTVLSGTSRNRGSSVRSRSRGDFNADPVLPTFDGTITVTHVLPTEVTIPVINGKLTEYKNVVTAKTSTEVLAPQQYTSIVGANGQPTLVLTREDSSVNFSGATEITQYVLHETPTTTVTFTPTTIRGRKTSFSHVIPSTVYSVENVVSTAQPQISANAPLANILLSQLLLGNIGLPSNPLLGALTQPAQLGAVVAATVATPVTEYRTHTSTYVTTLVEGMSTVIPVTFQGKKILTTIYDTTAQTITATEFITDTIVTTPTQQPAQAAQVNSLLLQQLLLQQQLQQTHLQQQEQPHLPLQHVDVQSPLLLTENLQELDTNNIRISNDADDLDDIQLVEETQSPKSGGRKKSRKSGKSGHKRNKQHQQAPQQESSVITLYVSGRRPGEFSTILSTVPVGYDSSSTHHKRQVHPTAIIDTPEDFYAPDGSEIVSEYVLPDFEYHKYEEKPVNVLESGKPELPLMEVEGQLVGNILLESKEQTTQSLESIVGDVSLWYAKSTAQYERQRTATTAITTTTNFLNNIRNAITTTVPNLGYTDAGARKYRPVTITPTVQGVESTGSGGGSVRFFVHGSFDMAKESSIKMAMTPMKDVAPTPVQSAAARTQLTMSRRFNVDDELNDFEGLDDDLGLENADEARHNLATRIMSNGVEVIIAGDKSKTIEPNSNKQNKPPNILRILQTQPLKPMTLAPSTLKNQMILMMPSNVQENYSIPIDTNHFITKTCLTTYTYRTTYLQGGITTVDSREKVISNIATEERNYLKLSPTASLGVTLSHTPEFAVGVFHTTYTYYNTVLDDEMPLVVTSRHTVTNTITGPDDYIAFLQSSEEATPVLETNTYYSRITLTKTMRHSSPEQIVSTANILTQVIVTESLPSRTTSATTSNYALEMINPIPIAPGAPFESESVQADDPNYDIHIYATKTFLTTFTYFTTMMKQAQTNNENDAHIETTSTMVNYHTRVIENVITETVPNSLLSSALLSKFRFELKKTKNQRQAIVTLVTFNGGQTLEITAMKILKPASTGGELSVTLEKSPDIDSLHTPSRTQTLDSMKTKRPSQLSITASRIIAKSTAKPNVGPTTVKNNPAITSASLLLATRLPAVKRPDLDVEEEDSLVSGSEQEAVFVSAVRPASPRPPEVSHEDIPNNNNNNNKTKQVATTTATTTKPTFPGAVNQIIGSLKLNHLTALRPVFNAMAGLLHNNFRVGMSNNKEHVESKHSLKNITASNINYESSGLVHHGNEGQPIYIPVKNVAGSGQQLYATGETAVNPSQLSPQSLHIQPPAEEMVLNDDNWLQEAASKLLPQHLYREEGIADQIQFHNRPLAAGRVHEKPLLNGGIPISPGEVITANSDVIIGKPNGIQYPRVPFNGVSAGQQLVLADDSSTAAAGKVHTHALHPPPLASTSTFYQQFIQHPYKKTTLPNVVPFQKVEQQQPQSQPHQILLSHSHQHQQQKHTYHSPSPTNFDNILKPPPLHAGPVDLRKAELQMQPLAERPSYIQLPPPPPAHSQQHLPLQRQKLKQHNSYMPHGYSEAKYQTIPGQQLDPKQQQHQQNLFQFNHKLQNNEILEIKRIPEVFSTDLPPETEFTAYQGLSATEEYTRRGAVQQQQQATLPNGVSALYSAIPTLLVNVQPSRVTNVLIPHMNGALSTGVPPNEHYYTENNHNKNNDVDDTRKATSIAKINPAPPPPPKKPLPGSEPHLNLQKINFDTHVFSHNVDINVPPLTFKKDAEFPPQSDPVRGQIPSSLVQHEFPQMPLVKIPLTEEQVQVDLTPNHVVGSLAPVSSDNYELKLPSPDDFGVIGSFTLQVPAKQVQAVVGSAAYKHRYSDFHTLSQRPLAGSLPPTGVNDTKSSRQHVSVLENSFTIANELDPVKPAAASSGYGLKVISHTASMPSYISSQGHSSSSPPDIPHEGKPHTEPTRPTHLSQAAPNRTLNGHWERPSHKHAHDYDQQFTATSSAHRPHRPYSAPKKQRRPPLSQIPFVSSSIPSETTNAEAPTSTPTTAKATTVEPKPTSNKHVPPKKTVNYWNHNSVVSADTEEAAAANGEQKSVPSWNSVRRPHPDNNFLAPKVDWTINRDEQISQIYVNVANQWHEHITPVTTSVVWTTRTTPKSTSVTKTWNKAAILPSSGKPFEATRPKSNRPSDVPLGAQKRPAIFVTSGEGFKRPQAISLIAALSTYPSTYVTTKATKSTRPTSTTKPVLDMRTTKSPVENAIHKEQGVDKKTTNNYKEKDNDIDEIFDFHETSNPHNLGTVNTTGIGLENVQIQGLVTRNPPVVVSHKLPLVAGTSPTAPSSLFKIRYNKYVNIRPPPPPPSTTGATEAVEGLNPPPPPPSSSQPQSAVASVPTSASKPYKTIYNYTSINRLPLLSPPQQQVSNDPINVGTRQPVNQKVPFKYSPILDQQTLLSNLKPHSPASNVFSRLQPGEATTFLPPATTTTMTAMKTPSLSSTSFITSNSIHFATRSSTSSSSKIAFKPSPLYPPQPPSSSSQNPVGGHNTMKNYGHHIIIDSTEDNEVTPNFQGSRVIENLMTNTKIHRPPVTSIRNEFDSKSWELSESMRSDQNSLHTEIYSHVASKNAHSVPTKFITNTHILTVTTTKTTVSTAAGRQTTKTLTLTKTQTATVLDTVTEFHTLLQPTRVTESHIIVATTVPVEVTDSSSTVAPTAAPSSREGETDDNRLLNHKVVYHHNHRSEPGSRHGDFSKKPVPTFTGTARPSVEIVLSDAAIKQHQKFQENQKRLQYPPGPEKALSSDTLNSDPNNNSIFIVMTDKPRSGNSSGNNDIHININPNILESAHNINKIGVSTLDTSGPTGSEEASIGLDYDEDVSFEFPMRDEEGAPNSHKANHVLLGGVLIATPPKSSSSSSMQNGPDTLIASGGTAMVVNCRPACKASRNELCMRVQTRMRCVCRPGFARMFPDRPCKPTYTYAMQIPVHRVGHELLHFEEQLLNDESEDFRQLAVITHDAVDRMVMQSDFRDVYHGVHMTSFGTDPSVPETIGTITANFLLQLSDNSDERRLANVFKKYLRLSNYSIGGTELFTTKDGVESMAIVDFDECAHSKFHDCSENARCFNLQGTYTCSCQEGFADHSENPIYPGRLCSAEIIGCEKCHYHGKCVAPSRTVTSVTKSVGVVVHKTSGPICECFPWYTGASCQLNLKILLIALIAIGTLLSFLLLFCLLVTCSSRNKHRKARALATGMYKLGPGKSDAHLSAVTGRSKSIKIDKRAMIKDSSSETSHNSLPYVLKETTSSTFKKHSSHRKSFRGGGNNNTLDVAQHASEPLDPSTALISVLENSINDLHHHYPDQSDRSLTVMIPRAKYHHPSVLPQTKLMHHQLTMERPEHSKGSATAVPGCREYGGHDHPILVIQGNDVGHLKVQPMISHSTISVEAEKKVSTNNTKHTGALVSAGFEVSATVSGNLLNSVNGDLNSSTSASDGMIGGTGEGCCTMNRFDNTSTTSAGEVGGNAYRDVGNDMNQLLPSYMSNDINMRSKAKPNDRHVSESNNYKDGEDLIDTMDVWLETIHQTELTAEARSFDETTVQAPTKCIRNSDTQESQTNDEANTMAERDIGSTFLLPHTHLYKPDRHQSDLSGFDSS